MISESTTTATIAKRETMITAWRTARALRLHWILLLGLTALLFLNIFFSMPRVQEEETVHVTEPLKIFKGLSYPQSAPLVQHELSSGVREEENSAREVVDVEGGEAREQGRHNTDADAANEVNSAVEQEPSGRAGNLVAPGNWRNLTEAEIARMSVLGRHMFLGEKVSSVRENKTFTILVWKYGPKIESRLLKEYGKVKQDPFRNCLAHNCRLTYEDDAVKDADAILFHLHRIKGPHEFPNRTRLDQRWIWLTDESAYFTFMMASEKHLQAYNGFFNWSMSYRMDTDVPVPYGRTLPLTPQEADAYQHVDYYSLKPKLVAIMGSNCGGANKRWSYVHHLQKHVALDAYGGCGSLKCPGHFLRDCPLIDQYKFYLSFENGNCKEYITEKVWWNAFSKGAVPVVMGSRVEDYHRILPPNSFLHVDDFPTPESLARHLIYLGNNKTAYNQYHEWRTKYKIVNEHGYFQTPVYHYCRICEALNFNSQETKIYDDLESFWGKSQYCYPPTWETRLKEYTTRDTQKENR